MKTPRRKKTDRKPRPGPKTARRRGPSPAGLQQLLDLRTRERDEALEQQAATAEVLRVIANSPGTLEPVFQAMLENATRICEAELGNLCLYKDGRFQVTALHGAPQAYVEARRRNPMVRPGPATGLGRLAATKKTVHIVDTQVEPGYFEVPPGFTEPGLVKFGRARTELAVAMLKDGVLVGAIVIYRQQPRPFTDKQVELVTNFAAQAVIAIENTRLLNELRESLQQQTATAEVLKVISSSAGELQSVFDAMLENAVRLCGAKFGAIYRWNGELLTLVAEHNLPSAFAAARRQAPFRPNPRIPLGWTIATKKVNHVIDLAAEEGYRERLPGIVESVELGLVRTVLQVPMLDDDELVGILAINRQEVLPFTEKQIELVSNFAAQAVIAIENTRLLNELRQRTDDLTESLEQQTATSQVLKVISSSPGELEPVFQSMLMNATKICGAKFGTLFRYDGKALDLAAQFGTPAALIEFQRKRGPFVPQAGTRLHDVLLTKQVVHVEDDAAGAVPGFASKLGGGRTYLGVPMLKDNELVGIIVIFRQEVRPFTDKQVELVTNFAAQAVIAIENTRLLNELRQSLQQQTATADVLKTISRSTFDLPTVLETLVQSAAVLCDADAGIIRQRQADNYPVAATFGLTAQQREHFEHYSPKPDRASVFGRAVLEGRTIHVPDVLADPEHNRPGQQHFASVRALLGVPLTREGAIVGVFTLYRQEPRPFNQKQIELVTTFADQAVIAIENTRLLNELRESLQQQTATADVLKTISRSTFDLQSVLNTLVDSASRLCDADGSIIWRPHEGHYKLAASCGLAPEFKAQLEGISLKPEGRSVIGRTLKAKQTIHVPNMADDPEYATYDVKRLGGYRAMLGVPLMREGVPVGVMMVGRKTPRAFTEAQIALVTTFADQAVIAIENVRLFDEIQDKSHQLAEASKHKSQFLANMSHELRTPLNAILGYTELVLDGIYGEAPQRALDVLKRVESNGRHLLGLINDVLDLSKIEAGELKLSLTEYSMKDVVYNVFGAVEPLATKKKLDFKVNIPPDMPAGHGDERRLTQVLLNLVGNAIKFTDAGAVAIKIASADGAFSVAVHDTGPGISAADQAKLFQEFQQADSSITKSKGGTGLGLAISRRIVELHGGRLWVESSPGEGSTFTFTIPVTVEQQARPT